MRSVHKTPLGRLSIILGVLAVVFAVTVPMALGRGEVDPLAGQDPGCIKKWGRRRLDQDAAAERRAKATAPHRDDQDDDPVGGFVLGGICGYDLCVDAA